MTIRDLIKELEEIAERFGDQWEVRTVKDLGTDEPILSFGHNITGDPPELRII